MSEEDVSRISAPIILIVEFLLALILAVYLLYKYGDIRRQNPFVTVCTLIIWFMSFVIIFLLPVDVSSAFYELCLDYQQVPSNSCELIIHDNSSEQIQNCSALVCPGSVDGNFSQFRQHCVDCCFQPYSFVCPLPLEIIWYIIYWLFFLLSWIVLPLEQSYVLASYFSFWKKILRALIENALFYVTFLVIFVILFIYLVIVEKIVALENIPSLLATASNTWGLLILTLLLGYGLVEVPRTLWNASRRTYSLNHCYFKAAKLYIDMSEGDEKLKDVTERVSKIAKSVHYNDPFRRYVNIIIKKYPKEMQTEFSKGHDDYEDFQSTEDPLTKSSLESLLKKTMKAVRYFNSTRIQWLALTDQTLELEDVGLNATKRPRIFESSLRKQSDSWLSTELARAEWYWKLWVRPWAYRIGAIFLAFLSLLLIWSEVTFSIQQVKPSLSIFAVIVHELHAFGNYLSVEILSICVVAYLSVCAYFTVFKIKIFNLYYLAPHHSTDEYSLLFSAVLLSRLALPICLNYLYVIAVVDLQEHEDPANPRPQTAFAFATGNTALIPWLTNYFYIYYPIVIVLVCIATFFSVGSRLASIFGYQKFIGEDDFSADYIDEGKTLMKRERRIRQRHLRDTGKATPRDRLPLDILKETGASETNRTPHKRRSTFHEEDDEDKTRFGRFVSRAKGLAKKSKDTIAAKYTAAKNRGRHEDSVELLPNNSSSEDLQRTARLSSSLGGGSVRVERGSGYTQRSTGSPPRDLFDDL